MRIAVLADIHGNLLALEAVIADLSAGSPDVVVNLGDHLSGPLWAAETADLLMAQSGWVHIRGNHDRQLIEVHPGSMGLSDRAARERLSSAHLAWLASLPPHAQPADGLLLVHGTPESDSEYLLEDVSAGFARPAPPGEIRASLGNWSGAVLCGHSHVPRSIRVDEHTSALNPGSVGLQAYDDLDHRHPHVIENGSPHARYLLLDRRGNQWHPAFRNIPYKHEIAAQMAESRSRPDWAFALRTGYAVTGRS